VINTLVTSGRDKQGCPPLSPCVPDAAADASKDGVQGR